MTRSKTIVFIHGAFVTFHCWDDWVRYFREQGYSCRAPAWPHKNADAKALRTAHPDSLIGSLTFSQIVDHYAALIRSLDEKPILIGHSIGGLFVQILLQQDLGAAGVAIHAAPPFGVFTTKISFLRSGWKGLLPTSKPYLMSFQDWRYAFANGLPPEVQLSSYDRLLIPESRRVLKGLLKGAARINFALPHAPLLFIAGGNDHFIPASLNVTNYRKYRDDQSITQIKTFEGRTHFVLGQEGWREVAAFIAGWLQSTESS